jgi:DnaK suppressor protein
MVTKSRSASGAHTAKGAGKKSPRVNAGKAKPAPKAPKPKTAKPGARKPAANAPAHTRTSARPSPPKTRGDKRERPRRPSPAAEQVGRTPPRPPATGGGKGENDLLTLRNTPLPYEIVEGETYMSAHQKEHFRRLLEAWRHELMEEVDRTVRYMQDEAANFPDANDRATQESEFSLELRTRDRERKLIRKIDEALTRIETDEYGYCVTCGEAIGIRRLEARPIATQCIDCKERDERRERQNRGL